MARRFVHAKVQLELDKVGAVLVRDDNHFVFEIPGVEGKFIMAKTASDQRAVLNQVARIRRLVRNGKGNNR